MSRTICARSLGSGSSRSMRSLSLPASLMCRFFWIKCMMAMVSMGGSFLKVMLIMPGAASTLTTPYGRAITRRRCTSISVCAWAGSLPKRSTISSSKSSICSVFLALAGLLGQPFNIGHHQVGIGLVVAAADPAAQLVQLRQTEFVGAAHHNGVGAGHVNAGFNDGGAQQQVEALGHKVFHHALQLA